MILVTGAAGKTGQTVVRHLATAGQQVRALVRRQEQADPLRALGAAEVVVGDMRVETNMRDAMAQIDAVYHLAPNMHLDEIDMGRLAIDAARSSRVERFVFHSVLHPQTEKMPHHWQKLRVEEMLFESKLPFTILQPAAYMQNVQASWAEILENATYRVPYATNTPLSLVDLEDVAEVAALTLTESGHEAATYELAGPDPLTAEDIATIVGRESGQPVRAETIPREEWQRDARAAGMSDSKVETLSRMFEYYEQYGLLGNSRVLRGLLGREPTGFSGFVRRVMEDRGAEAQRTREKP